MIMKDIKSCEHCGVIVDLSVLREHSIGWDNTEKTKDAPYKNFQEFIHWICPVCKCNNQIDGVSD